MERFCSDCRYDSFVPESEPCISCVNHIGTKDNWEPVIDWQSRAERAEAALMPFADCVSVHGRTKEVRRGKVHYDHFVAAHDVIAAIKADT